MKYLFTFLVTFLIGVLIVIGYGIVKKNPGKPINNIIETATKPTYSIENAPSQTIKGTITQISGDVKWESRIATVSSSLLEPLPVIEQGEGIDTQDNGVVSVDFPGAVSIAISSKTQIDFVQTLPVNFVVSIASGSAEFKKTGNVPITVRAYHLLIRQDSGDLKVVVDQNNSLVNFDVLNGSITTAYNDQNLVSHEVNFNSGQKVSFNDLTRTFGF